MIVFVVASTLAAMNSSTAQFDMQTHAEPDKDHTYVNFKGLYKMLPIVVYANIFHHSIPGLSLPVGDKRNLSKIFTITFVLGMFAYSLIGGVVAWYFGASVDQSANLNWINYHAGTG